MLCMLKALGNKLLYTILIVLFMRLVVLLTLLSFGKLGQIDTYFGMVIQCNQSSNSKLEDSAVIRSKTDSYVPVSALCAESTIKDITLKLIRFVI